MNTAFTADGSPEAESRVRADLTRIVNVIRNCLPADSLEMIGLAGGFGRGEGGVIRLDDGTVKAFNDYDLVVFTRGNPSPDRLVGSAPGLAAEIGVDFVDFGILDRAALDRIAPTIFWYEFLDGHRILWGPGDYLDAVSRIDPARLPLIEATRLLINRGIGLLWAWLHLEDAAADPKTFDDRRRRFTVNAIHKAVLALGEASLIQAGAYHASYRERARRVAELELPRTLLGVSEFRPAHAASTQFKLHPEIPPASIGELRARWQSVRGWHEAVFRWIEETRLGRSIGHWKNYPRRAGEEALARGVRHPRHFLGDRRSGSPLRDLSRFVLDSELSHRAQLPFLLYGAGLSGPDSEFLASGLRGFEGEKSRDAVHWRNLAGSLIGQWHP